MYQTYFGGSTITSAHTSDHAAFSVCLIAKNEERNMKRCLDALAPLQAEIIVVDTGSTDKTAEIAKENGARVISFSWTGSFSNARNFAASQASHDLVLAVDADEYLEEANLPLLAKQIEAHKGSVGMMTRISPTVRDGAEQSLRERVARFYDKTRFHYAGSIHENITPLNPGTALSFFELPLTFLHVGYETADLVVQKANRDLSMLLAALETEDDKPYLHYQTGKSYVALKKPEKAIDHYEQAMALHPDDRLFYVQDMTESYGYCLLETGRADQALSFLLSAPAHASEHADFCFLLGLVYMNNAMFPEAVEAFEKATTCKNCSVEGCNSYRAYYNIGVIWEVTGNVDEARLWYQKCGAFEPARIRLAGI